MQIFLSLSDRRQLLYLCGVCTHVVHYVLLQMLALENCTLCDNMKRAVVWPLSFS